MHLRTRSAPRSRVQPSSRVAVPVRAKTKGRPVHRMVGVAVASCLVAWACLGIVIYFQDGPAPYVLDREDD